MKRLLLIVVLVLVAAPLFAQPVAEEPTTPNQWYGSVAGIVVATGLAVSILKRALAKVPAFNQVPLWLYAVVISSGLTYLTNQVFHTMPGDLWQLLMQSVSMAATASGFYSWLTSSDEGAVASLTKPLAASPVAEQIIAKG